MLFPSDAAPDLIIHGCAIVTMDDAATVIRDGAIAIRDGRIAWLGNAETAARMPAKRKLDARGQIALPGMIDAHVHTAQQLLRGRIAAIGRTRALRHPTWKNYLVPFESLLTADEVYLSARFAFANMIEVGTTCFAEAGGPFPDEIGRAAVESGLRGFIALSTIDQNAAAGGASVPAGMVMRSDEALERNVDLVTRWRDHPRVKAWLALRQILVCSPELISGISEAAHNLNTKIHTHLCEGVYEIDYAAEKFGRRPAEYLADLGVLSPHLHCAHSILLSPGDVDLYARHRPSACHCAFNNYQVGFPRLAEMWRRGIDIGLGTDGPVAWSSLDMFQVAHQARIGQQAVAGAPWAVRSAISSEEVLAVATRGGARALGLADTIGSIEQGKAADLLLCEANGLDQLPMADPLFTAACSIIGRDVRTVFVNGEMIMKDREILTMDVEALRAELTTRLPGILDRFERLVA